MIAIHPSSSYSILPSVQESLHGLGSMIKKVAVLFYENVCYPIHLGITVGIYDFSSSVLLELGLERMGLGSVLANEIEAALYEESLKDVFDAVVVAPILEEFIFRFLLQNVFHFVARNVLPDINVDLFSYQIKLAALTSIVATSLLFGLAHLGNGLGIIQVILCTVGGITLGILKQHYGMLACTAAHMTNNAIAETLMILTQK